MASPIHTLGSAVDACLPKDAAGTFIPEKEKSDVVHDLLAFLAEQMLEMNKQKQQEIKGFLGWLEGFVCARWKTDTQDKVAELLRARLRELFSCSEEEPKGSGRRSCSPGAR